MASIMIIVCTNCGKKVVVDKCNTYYSKEDSLMETHKLPAKAKTLAYFETPKFECHWCYGAVAIIWNNKNWSTDKVHLIVMPSTDARKLNYNYLSRLRDTSQVWSNRPMINRVHMKMHLEMSTSKLEQTSTNFIY